MPWIAVAGLVGGAAVFRLAYATAKRINRELDEARLRRVSETATKAELPTLRRDPISGAYRPS